MEITVDELFGPVMQTMLYVVPLVTVLFWLDYLVYFQYRQEIEWWDITVRSVKGAPGMFWIPFLPFPLPPPPFFALVI